MINILYISPFGYLGGGEISISTIINNLDRENFNPLVVCYEEGVFPDSLRRQGIECLILKRKSYFSDPAIILSLVRLIKYKKIDLVHVNSLDIRAGLAAKLSATPFVGHLRVIFPFTWRDSLFVWLSNITIAVSTVVVNILAGDRLSIRDKFIVMPPAIDIPVQTKHSDLRQEFGLEAGTLLIGIVGRLDPFKGHPVFIDMAAEIKKRVSNIKFLVIGGSATGATSTVDTYEMELRSKVSGLGLDKDFIFTGFRADVLSVIGGLDILVIPSHSVKKGRGELREGFGRVAVEAMAMGVPVVASLSGGLPEIIQDKVNGLLVPPDDPIATAEAVIWLKNNPKKTEIIKQKGRERFEEFYSTRNLVSLYELYAKLAKKN
ncbi:MAG: glycosyltransferase family 4 protein [Candidatus Omnitrophota bacterium]